VAEHRVCVCGGLWFVGGKGWQKSRKKRERRGEKKIETIEYIQQNKGEKKIYGEGGG